MAAQIADQVIDFYSGLFESLFAEPFRPLLADRLKRKAVERQIEESSDAASQSLTRFFLNQQLTENEAATILTGCAALCESLDLERISNPNVTPEGLAEELLERVPVPDGVPEPDAPVTRIMEALKETAHHPGGADRRPDNRWGHGTIQPAEALKALA